VKRRSIAIAASIALIVVVAFGGFLATRHAVGDATSFRSPLLGQPAPYIAVAGTDGSSNVSTLDGKAFNLTSLKGHVVVLNFWASWCNPCVKEAPELTTFAWQHRGQVVTLGVLFNDEVGAARRFQAQYGSLYPSVVDNGGQIANAYGVVSPPTTFVIDTAGRVAATLVGATSAAQLSRVVARVSTP
jgi:thiol-disulfide isomerase/thioredoxin